MTWLVLHVTWCRIRSAKHHIFILIVYLQTIGTAACPPYHLAFAIGGTSAEMNLKCVKLASTKYFDNLPTSGTQTMCIILVDCVPN